MEEFGNIGPVEDDIHVEGIGATGADYAAVELLINFVNFLWQEWYALPQVMRLNGGGLKRQRSFQMAPYKAPRQRTFLDFMDIDTPTSSEIRAWRELENAGNGHRYVEGLGDSTVSVADFPYRPPMPSPISLEGRIASRYYRDMVSERLMYGAAVGTGAALGTLRITYPGYGGSDSNVKSSSLGARTNINIVNKDQPMNGYSMLEWKNRLTRKLKTHYTYRMSALLLSQQQIVPDTITSDIVQTIKAGNWANYSTLIGSGPGLIGTYVITPFTDGSDAAKTLAVNPHMLELEIEDVGYFTSVDDWRVATDSVREHTRGVGVKNVVYWFAADWIGGAMNPFAQTQNEAYDWSDGTVAANNQIADPKIDNAILSVFNQRSGACLLMKPVTYTSTTDLNLPIDVLTLFSGVQRWTYITHYYTVWNFRFVNFAEIPYCIEIVKFKFKSDIDAMNYERGALAVVDRQRHKFQDYVDGVSNPPSDIVILYRKRIVIGGINQQRNSTSGANTNYSGSNVVNWKYVQKRKYVIKRPIVNAWDEEFGEFKSFNTYYEAQNGEYLRMQGWPIQTQILFANGIVLANEPTIYNNPNVTNARVKGQGAPPPVPSPDVSNMVKAGTAWMQCVDVTIDKKSYFKLDESIN